MAKRVKAAARQAAEPEELNSHNLGRKQLEQSGKNWPSLAPMVEWALSAFDRGDFDWALMLAYQIGQQDAMLTCDSAFGELMKKGEVRQQAEASRKAKLAAEFKPRLEKAIERLTQLRNERGDEKHPSDFSLRRKAAGYAGITERALRNNLPAYLK
jgi:hypothetical protein